MIPEIFLPFLPFFPFLLLSIGISLVLSLSLSSPPHPCIHGCGGLIWHATPRNKGQAVRAMHCMSAYRAHPQALTTDTLLRTCVACPPPLPHPPTRAPLPLPPPPPHTAGVFKKSDILELLEIHFRCQEQKMVLSLVGKDLPAYNARLQQLTTPGVVVEVLWATIFHAGIRPWARL